ncbi:MAG: hypothetical protein WEB60_09750 [Terrimicrobiaceae bacterium]
MTDNTQDFTEWLDGKLSAARAAKFEADPEALAEREAWNQLRATLVSELAPPAIAHPDFINSRVLEAIERDRRVSRPSGNSLLRRLVFAGLASVSTAAVITLIFLPDSFRRPSESEFISQVVSARAGNPKVSVSSFHTRDDRGVVIWIEGTQPIPSDEIVR